MKKTLPAFLALAAAGMIQFQPESSAQVVLIGNYPPVNDSGFSLTSSSGWTAAGFTTDNQSYDVNSVTLRLTSYDVGDVPQVGIYNSSGGVPGTQVGSDLVAPTSGTGPADFTFTPSGGLTLAPNSTYWLVVAPGTAGTSYRWNQSTTAPRTPVGIATSAGYLRWSNPGTGFSWNTAATFNTYQVNATPVPEPTAVASVFGLGLLGFGLWRQARRA